MTFYVGQKVVFCGMKNADPKRRSPPEYRLIKGNVYTIRDIDTRFLESHGSATIRLEEMLRPIIQCAEGPFEQGYHPANFRPVVERKTDTGMAILRKLLNTKPAKAPVL